MAEKPALKLASPAAEIKSGVAPKVEAAAKAKVETPARSAEPQAVPAPKPRRKLLRFILLFVVPLVATVAGLSVYLAGGRYISTDNAYVGAQKVLITPDISGRISRVLVKEGERVEAGAPVFEIDAQPFRDAVTQSEARLAGVQTEFANIRSNLAAIDRLLELARQNASLKQSDVERKQELFGRRATSQADVDISKSNLVTARTQVEQLAQQQANLRNQLLGDPNLRVEQYPPYMQAQAALDQARRDLDHTTLRAPLAGIATQVTSIQLGRYVTAGTPVFSIVDDEQPWVDANPKETDLTHLQLGQAASIVVDTYPDKVFRGRVVAVSPGTGAQFAILPPQNASGNWVKVVQRIPVRVQFDAGQDTRMLRAGMSSTVDIDTGRQRTLAGLFGGLARAKVAD